MNRYFSSIFTLEKKDELAIFLKRLESLIKKIKERGALYFCKNTLKKVLSRTIEFRLKKIDDLSITDLSSLAKIVASLKIQDPSLKKKLNQALDKKFKKIFRPNSLVKLTYQNPYLLPTWDAENLYHYIEAKEVLNQIEKLRNNQKLLENLRKTYEIEKVNWFKKRRLNPQQNKWVHFVLAMYKLKALLKEEKTAILKHNAKLKIDENQPILAQVWNRTWLFQDLGVRNINELKNIFLKQEFLKVKKNVCADLTRLGKKIDFEKEDLFKEGSHVMRYKYRRIQEFNKGLV